jgi:hypothetical protein
MEADDVDGGVIDPPTLSSREKATWDRQERFLVAYSRVGSIRQAAPAASIERTAVWLWQKAGNFGFNGRFQNAKAQFAESLEEIMFERIRDPQGNRGSDVLLIFALKAHHRAKYGDVPVADDRRAPNSHSSLSWRAIGDLVDVR